MRTNTAYARVRANYQRNIRLWTETILTHLEYRMAHLEYRLPRCDDDYIAFINIHTKADASNFLESRVPSPVGKAYFTPVDYIWETMRLKTELVQSHRRWFFSLWGLLNLKDKKMYDAQFRHRHSLIEDAINHEMDYTGATDPSPSVNHEMDYTGAWVRSRYDIPKDSYLAPVRFAQAEFDDDWDRKRTIDFINFPFIDYEYVKNIRYYWKNVKPSLETRNDGRRHAILMDIDTEQEAPLLTGLKPYRDVQSIQKS